MSSILEALRKLDEQKSVRRHPQVDVTRGVVRGTTVQPGMRVRPWQLGIALLLVALVSTAITLWVTRPVKPSARPPQSSAVVPTPPAQILVQSPPVAVQPVQPQSQAKPVQPPVTPSASAPVSDRPATKLRLAPLQMPVQKPALAPAVTPAPVPLTPAVTAPLEVPATVEPARPIIAAPTPALKVTGIGWQKDAASRYAVINGTAVSEGGSVDGFRVEEIMPDRVRLRSGDRVIEPGLGK